MEKLISFHGKQEIKDKYIQRLKNHMLADEIIQGIGFDKLSNKGCAIGCTLDKYDHFAFETELGIPAILAVLEDNIFEGLSLEDSKEFPLNVLYAIPIGIDLEIVYAKIFHWQLTNEKWGIIKDLTNEKDIEYFTKLADLYKNLIYGNISFNEFRNTNLAHLAYRAYLADRAYRAYRAYLTDLAYRPDYYKDLAEYFIQTLKQTI